jgi:hypothetical protein
MPANLSNPYQPFDQTIDVAVKVGVGPDLDAMSIRQLLERGGQLLLGRDARALNQYWNDENPALQGYLHLDAYIVVRVLQPRPRQIVPLHR